MAEAVTPHEPARPAARTPYGMRFGAIYLALALVAGAAVGGLLLAATSSENHPKAAIGNRIATTDLGELRALQLADRVGRTYRLADGGPVLADVIASRNTFQTSDLGTLRVRFHIVQPFDALRDEDTKITQPKDAIQYTLCGTARDCALPVKATVGLEALLYREALELGVRTLQGDPAVDDVVVIVRPIASPTQDFDGYAVVMDRDVVAARDPSLLTAPPATVIPDATPTVSPSSITQTGLARLAHLVQPYRFLYRYSVLGGRDPALELQPTAPQS